MTRVVVNRSKTSAPDVPPTALKEYRRSRILRLAEEYLRLEPLALRIGLKEAEMVPAIIDDVIDMVDSIEHTKISPQEAVDLSFHCVKKMQHISYILEEAKELERSE